MNCSLCGGFVQPGQAHACFGGLSFGPGAAVSLNADLLILGELQKISSLLETLIQTVTAK